MQPKMQDIHLWKAMIHNMEVFIELKVNFPQTNNYILYSDLLRIESQLQQSGTDSTLWTDTSGHYMTKNASISLINKLRHIPEKMNSKDFNSSQ